MRSLLITICARGGSKGIPGKNIKPLNGVPLLHYTLNLAQIIQEKYGADIQVSTDSDEILKCAAEVGYSTEYIRPDEFATDKAGKIAAIEDAMLYSERLYGKTYDYILDLDVTSPLRTLNDIEQAYEQLSSNEEALNIFSVSPAARNPYFNMVETGENGFAKVVKDAGDVKSRQNAPLVYDMNASFYLFKREYFNKGYSTSTTPYSLAYVMKHHCFDLDEPRDFRVMEILLSENLLEIEI
ncbi:acylneuraminate cytidylyltransferase family protein [Phaeocystidibacter marisrubri]|uniref:Acylneuraminate cytidylyltransferase family protein n=1 Tax=Phaeocystidibacter marisrubri TaxID=1577780 RepID=A0A6L3ZJ53_9FLAO|nr:acylneuraminate cytidylyltransferase family protein [Phaeocystidibacter marisrubri]KAB2817588.1 acylneuraminate cytidylyltransferase family protein [Phaeocystidibacter marisrubri]GGH74606.1 CMP-N,N'-diacetyllegionaminic acid synthase [Phaeocystidibacter marisrubri]